MTDTAPRVVTASRQLRCFPCCLGNCTKCHGDPCEHHTASPDAGWPPQTDSHPFDLPVGDQR